MSGTADGHQVSDDARAWLDWFEKAGVLPEAVQAHKGHEAPPAEAKGADRAGPGRKGKGASASRSGGTDASDHGYGGPTGAPPDDGAGPIDGAPEGAGRSKTGGPAANGADPDAWIGSPAAQDQPDADAVAYGAAPGGPGQDGPLAKIASVDPAVRGGKVEVFVKRQSSPGTTEEGKVGTLLGLGDKVQTGPETVCAIEFLIGGRAALTKNTCVEVLGERSVGNEASFKRIVLKTANLWIKADAAQLKQPLEIQTNGGVMGIKG